MQLHTRQKKKLKKLSQNDENNLVKMYAGLTLIYLKDNQLSNSVKINDTQDPMKFFGHLQNEIYTDFFTTANK